MCQDKTKEKLEADKLLLKLHLKYILGISFACICLVIVLSFCEDSTFKNCISVSSTVTSIILSVIAIILSVTGERTTNEIRNKVSDSVNKLEDCTNKSSELSDGLSATLQQLEALYENVNTNIKKIPKIESTLNEVLLKNNENTVDSESGVEDEDNVAKHIIRFVTDVFLPNDKEYLKMAYSFLLDTNESKPISSDDIIQHLVKNGADTNTALLVIGLMFGNLCTGKMNIELVKEIIRNL